MVQKTPHIKIRLNGEPIGPWPNMENFMVSLTFDNKSGWPVSVWCIESRPSSENFVILDWKQSVSWPNQSINQMSQRRTLALRIRNFYRPSCNVTFEASLCLVSVLKSCLNNTSWCVAGYLNTRRSYRVAEIEIRTFVIKCAANW